MTPHLNMEMKTTMTTPTTRMGSRPERPSAAIARSDLDGIAGIAVLRFTPRSHSLLPSLLVGWMFGMSHMEARVVLSVVVVVVVGLLTNTCRRCAK